MGITLTSKTINSTYDSLLKLSDNDSLTGAFKVITDGLGNDTGISLNNNGEVKIATSLQLGGGVGTQGTFSWNVDEDTVDLIQNGTTLQIGQEIHYNVKNQTQSTIPNGTAVMAVGTVGASGRILIAPMDASSSGDPSKYIGITTEDIASGADGKVTHFGKVRGLDTDSYTEGTVLWLDPTTDGGFTATQPQAPNLKIATAYVINKHANNGTIFVRANAGIDLHNNHRVQVSSLADKDLLVWNNTNSRWENSKTIGNVTTDYITAKGISLGGVATPEITFNGTSDTGIDMAITATPEGLDFYEPEQGNKIHFQILDDLGVNSLYGYKVAGSDFVDASRNITAGTISSGNITTSGYLRGPATFVIDPSAYGDETGLVQILGDLRVDGTTTTVNSTTVTINDKNIVLADEATTAGDADGAGITINGANATLTYASATDDFTFNKRLTVIDSELYQLRLGTTGTTYYDIGRSNVTGNFRIADDTLGDLFELSQTSGKATFTYDVTAPTFIGDLTGNADTATKWATARTITLGGDLTGNVSIDGSANVTLTAAVADDSHNHDGRYYTETEADAKFLLNTTDTLTGDLTITDGTNPININTTTYSEIQSQNRPLLLNRLGNGVGIGTDSVGATLHIADSTPRILFDDPNVAAGWSIGQESYSGNEVLRFRWSNTGVAGGSNYVTMIPGAFQLLNSSLRIGVYDVISSTRNIQNVVNITSTGNISAVNGSFSGYVNITGGGLQIDGTEVIDTDGNFQITGFDFTQAVTVTDDTTGYPLKLYGVDTTVGSISTELDFYSGYDGGWYIENQTGSTYGASVVKILGREVQYGGIELTYNNTLIGGFYGDGIDLNNNTDITGTLSVSSTTTLSGTTNLYYTQLKDSLMVLDPNGSSFSTAIYRDGTNPHKFMGDGSGLTGVNADTVDSKQATDFTLDYVTDNGATTTNNIEVGQLNAKFDITGATPTGSQNTIRAFDTSATLAEGIGGGISFTGKYTNTGTYLDGSPYIKAYKNNANDGDYGYSLSFGTRKNNAALAEALRLNSDGDGIFTGDITAVDGDFSGSVVVDGDLTVGSNTLVVDSTNDAVGIGTTPSSLYKLNIRKDVNDPDIDFTFGQRIDVNLSGADNTTGDREQGGLWIDIDSSADGDASNEHRLYGIYNEVSFSGYSDIARGVYSSVYSANSLEKTTAIEGGYFFARQNSSSTSGGVIGLRGTFNYAYVDGAGTIDNAYGSYSFSLIASTRTENFTNVYGSYNEVQIDSTSTISGSSIFGVSSVIDNNTSGGVTASSSYLFRGAYQGDSLATTDYGLYITGEDNNYLESSLNIGTGNLQIGGTTVIDSSRNITAVNGTFSENLTLGNNQQLKFKNSANNAIGVMTFNTSNELVIFNGNSVNGDIIFKDGGPTGTTNLIINGYTGNVGIGTTNTSLGRLTVWTDSASDTVINARGRVKILGDGTLWWGSSADYGKLTWDTGKAVIRGESGKALSLGANGTQDTIYINTSQNVGIGTTSPSQKLDVNGNIIVSGTSHTLGSSDNETTSLTIRATNTAGSGAYATRINMIGYEGRAQGIFYLDETYSGKEWFSGLSYSAGFGNWQVGYDATGGQSEYIAQAYLTILETGNIGIGTTSPDAKLDVAAAGDGIRIRRSNGYPSIKAGTENGGNLILDSNGGAVFLNNYTSNNVYLATGGGNVGIGTTSPSTRLHVKGASGQGTGTSAIFHDSGSNGLIIHPNISGGSYNNACVAGDVLLRADGQYKPILMASHNGSAVRVDQTTVKFYTSNAQRMHLNSTGLGINKTNPSYTLDVGGYARLHANSTPTLRLETTNSSTYRAEIQARYSYAEPFWISAYNGHKVIATRTGSSYLDLYANGSTQATLTATGLGIGTTSPVSKMHLAFNADFDGLRIQNANRGHNYLLTTAGVTAQSFSIYDLDNSAFLAQFGNDASAFYTSGTERMRIDSSGNVGIGTTSPSEKLHVDGKIRANSWYTGVDGTNTLWSSTSLGTYLQAPAYTGTGSDISFRRSDGSVRMVIDTENGNVGIGTTSPSAKLQIEGDGTEYGGIILKRVSQQQHYIYTDGTYQFNRIGSSSPRWRWGQYGAASDIMHLDSTGLGIGTTSPTQHQSGTETVLHIANSNVASVNLDSTGGSGRCYVVSSTASGNFSVYDDDANSTRFNIDSSGNVGIGVTPPSTVALDVKESTVDSDLILGLTAGTGGRAQIRSFAQADSTTAELGFYTVSGSNTSERMRIDSSGNVGIGTTSPSAKLHSTGTILSDGNFSVSAANGRGLRFWNSDNYKIYMSYTGDGSWGGRVAGETTSDYNMYFRMTGGTNRGFVFRNNTTNVAGIDASGNIRTVADVVAYSSSDKSLKDNIKPIKYAIDKVKKIGGYTFDWNDKQDTFEGNDVGVIAQEIEEVLPQLVTTRDNGYKAVKYEKLVALLIEGMKEQQEQIDELKRRLDDCTK